MTDTNPDDSRSLEQAVGSGTITMLVTPDQRARPLAVLSREGQRLSYLTSRATEWMQKLSDGDQVALVIGDPGDSLFVSLTGTATTTDDAETLDGLWNPAFEAWFDGREDPNLVALHVNVHDGRYWDGPSSGIGRALRGLAGVATGEGRRTMGEVGDVDG